MRKRLSNSKLNLLTPAQRSRLARWFAVENLTYKQCQAKCQSEFGIHFSMYSLHSFWDETCAALIATNQTRQKPR